MNQQRKIVHNYYLLSKLLTTVMYGTGIEPVWPREFLAVHHCSSSFEIIVNISPFLKGKSSGSLQKKNAF